MLEVITREPTGPARSTPLLFVHGAWHGAWCWDEHLLAALAEHGHVCHALSLRGHGASPGRRHLRRTRIRDYVDDVAEVVAGLPVPPVLVGHSMGGFIVQQYLEQHTAAGAALLASIPPTGAWRATVAVARRQPLRFLEANLRLRLAPLVATPALAREFLFSSALTDGEVRTHQRRLQDESYLAFLDMLALDLVHRQRVHRVPMLVLGAADDALVSPDDVRRTASTYGAEVAILPGSGHDLILDVRWRDVVDRLVGWLDSNWPAAAAGA